MTVPAAIRWEGGRLWLLDQRELPEEVVYAEQTSAEMVAASIAGMQVRGAPAIGIAAAYGLALDAHAGRDVARAARLLVAARPTAVNLAWAVNRVLAASDAVAEAEAIHREDAEMCRAIGANGMGLIDPGSAVLTHCNAGALAVSALGTATAPLYLAHKAGVRFKVFVDETQTAPARGASDGMGTGPGRSRRHPHLRQHGLAPDVRGNDRLRDRGRRPRHGQWRRGEQDRTRGIAITSRYHGIPFHVAFPSSTFDAETATGADVDIEQRDASEVTDSIRVAPGVQIRNPAFDVTPAELVTSWITDCGRIETARDLAKLK